jgi:hypothetical protein
VYLAAHVVRDPFRVELGGMQADNPQPGSLEPLVERRYPR